MIENLKLWILGLILLLLVSITIFSVIRTLSDLITKYISSEEKYLIVKSNIIEGHYETGLYSKTKYYPIKCRTVKGLIYFNKEVFGEFDNPGPAEELLIKRFGKNITIEFQGFSVPPNPY